MKVKEESEKVGLKLNIQKTKIVASSPITSWQIDGEIMETVTDFNLGGSKITADVDCSHEIKTCLLLGREVMTNLDSILKSRDITLPTKVHLVKAMVFLVVMYGCESWMIKKAEHWRTDTFELWCWRSLMRIPWTTRRSNQSILKEFSLNIHWKDWCWSWNSNPLATWCEEPTHLKRPWCWERLKAGGEGKKRGWDGWMASLTQWTWVWVSSGSWWWTGKPGVLQSMGVQRVRHDWATKLTELIVCVLIVQLCPILWDPMDYRPPGSPVHGILQARILERVVIPFSRGSSWPRDRTLHWRWILYCLSHKEAWDTTGLPILKTRKPGYGEVKW